MLPAEGFPGRKFVLPPRNVAPTSIVQKAPEGPFGPRTFSIFFEFDRSFMTYQYGDYLLDQAVQWLAAAKPKKVVVTGYAATLPEQISGQSLAERGDVAQERAELVATSLSRMIPALVVETRTALAAQPVDHPDADGLPGQSQRRVEITAEF
jgi:outer membrane protein OmpA-like peptidoglycan-associated protein